MLTGWRDGQIRSHDADTGQLLWSIDNAHARGVTSLVVSHNERFLVTGGMEGELRVWELRSRDLVSKGPVRSVPVDDHTHVLCSRI